MKKGGEKRKVSSDSDVVEEFLDCEYLKGEIIAVRTDGTDFYLAECSQNVTEEDLAKTDEFKVFTFLIKFLNFSVGTYKPQSV